MTFLQLLFFLQAMEEYSIAPEYLKNYQQATLTIKNCRLASPQFDQLTKASRPATVTVE